MGGHKNRHVGYRKDNKDLKLDDKRNTEYAKQEICDECGKPNEECEEYKAIMKSWEDFKAGKFDKPCTLEELLEELTKEE